jgi:hypothetical protein
LAIGTQFGLSDVEDLEEIVDGDRAGRLWSGLLRNEWRRKSKQGDSQIKTKFHAETPEAQLLVTEGG